MAAPFARFRAHLTLSGPAELVTLVHDALAAQFAHGAFQHDLRWLREVVTAEVLTAVSLHEYAMHGTLRQLHFVEDVWGPRLSSRYEAEATPMSALVAGVYEVHQPAILPKYPAHLCSRCYRTFAVLRLTFQRVRGEH